MILNLDAGADNKSSAPKARKKLRVFLGIGALAAVTGIGSTLAANITLSGDDNVEFGQGVVTTAACDGTITVTPGSTFINASPSASPAARFVLGSIAFTEVSHAACAGKTFTIKAYGASSATPIPFGISGTSPDFVEVSEIVVSVDATYGFLLVGGPTGIGITVPNDQYLEFTLLFDPMLTTPAATADIEKITIESS